MKIRKVLIACLFACIPFTEQVSAEICTLDQVPAATLLIPYFEVSLANKCAAGKFDTEVVVTNLSSSPAVAHVVIWSEWSVPLLDFNLELTGYDVDTFKLSDVVCAGTVKNGDTGATRTFGDDTIEHARAILSGKESPVTSMCGSHQEPSKKAIGYITIDTVTDAETSGSPADGASYVSKLSFDNVLVGDFYISNAGVPGANRICGKGNANCKKRYRRIIKRERGVPGVPAVAIEAGSLSDFSAGDRTFYGRYVSADASDRREPLPYAYHVRYAQTVGKKHFDMIVWREGNTSSSTVSCDDEPDWHPMTATQVVAFDESANALSIDEGVISESGFHDETQQIENALRDLEFDAGWIYFNFSTFFTASNAYSDSDTGAYVLLRRNGAISNAGVHAVSGTSCSASPLSF